MKVLAARIRHTGSSFDPHHLELLVDHIPRDELAYEAKKDKGDRGHPTGLILYFAESDGYVSFYAHNPSDESGFYGHAFTLRMKDGTERKIKGPWSSRSSAMNEYFTHSMECSITEDPDAFERGFTFYSGHVTVELAREIVETFCPGFEVVEDHEFGELGYRIEQKASGETSKKSVPAEQASE